MLSGLLPVRQHSSSGGHEPGIEYFGHLQPPFAFGTLAGQQVAIEAGAESYFSAASEFQPLGCRFTSAHFWHGGLLSFPGRITRILSQQPTGRTRLVGEGPVVIYYL